MRHELLRPAGVRYAHVVTHGEATLAGFLALTQETVQLHLPSRDVSLLVDHRDCDLSSMRKPDIDAFRRFVSGLMAESPLVQGGRPLKVATVVARPLDFGIVRQWEIPLEDQLPLLHRSFLDVEAAVAWLASEPEVTEPPHGL